LPHNCHGLLTLKLDIDAGLPQDGRRVLLEEITVRKTTLLLLLATTINFAWGEWKKIDTGYRSTAYADIETLRKQNNIATMTVLIDFEKPPFDGNNLPYLSLKMIVEYDCKTPQFRAMQITSHAGHMATGEKPYVSAEPQPWESIPEKSMQKSLWKTACGVAD
jgi:hypothetical protein